VYGECSDDMKVVGNSFADLMVDCQVIFFNLSRSLCWVIFSGDESNLLEEED
jgi:hypothetical protein